MRFGKIGLGSGIPHLTPMTTVARFVTPEEAHLCLMYLRDREIPAVLFDEHVVQLFWHLSNAMGGVRVAVPDENFQEAATALQEYRATIGTDPLPENEVRAWPLVAFFSMILGVPFLIFGRKGTRERAGE